MLPWRHKVNGEQNAKTNLFLFESVKKLNRYWRYLERFGHKPWPSSANAEGHDLIFYHYEKQDDLKLCLLICLNLLVQ